MASCHLWNWNPPAGFRFGWTDGLAIAICALVTWGAWPFIGDMTLLFPIVLSHFFLFCNVFRIPRRPELFWGTVFVINVGLWLTLDRFTWAAVLCSQLPVTLLVLVSGTLRKDYHGIGYRLVPWARRPDRSAEVDSRKAHLAHRS